jgi:hypothetical protein
MTRLNYRRPLLIVALLVSQALSGCIILPVPWHRHRVIVSEQPAPYPADPRRDHHERGGYR